MVSNVPVSFVLQGKKSVIEGEGLISAQFIYKLIDLFNFHQKVD